MTVLLLFFLICIVSLFSSNCSGRTFNSILNKSFKSGHPCLVPEFTGKIFRMSSLGIMLTMDLSCNGLYYIELCLLYNHFVEMFNHKCILIFFKWFFCIFWDSHIINFIPYFATVLYCVFWFPDIEPPLHSWNKSHLNMM